MSTAPIEAIIETLRRQFPLTRITLHEQFDGFQQVLAKLNFTSTEHDSFCFLKCFMSNASWWTGNSESIFDREVSAIGILTRSGLSTPKILASGKTDGVNWLLLESMTGTHLETDPLNFDPEQLGVFLASMHAFDISLEPELTLSRFDAPFIETDIREMASRGGCHAGAVDELARIAARFRDSSDQVFCHGDLNVGNVLVHESRDFGVLDFEESIIGYRQYDVGELAHGLRTDFSEECCQRFLNAYNAASGFHYSIGFLDEWCDFIRLRNRVVGIFLNNVGQIGGLPFTRGFVVDNERARDEIAAILTRRCSGRTNSRR
jgi:aminoglycoside phosphotransferase